MPQDQSLNEAIGFLRRLSDLGSVSFAARRMHVSKAVILERLSLIEKAVGEKLAVVEGRVVLTDAGQRLIHHQTGAELKTLKTRRK